MVEKMKTKNMIKIIQRFLSSILASSGSEFRFGKAMTKLFIEDQKNPRWVKILKITEAVVEANPEKWDFGTTSYLNDSHNLSAFCTLTDVMVALRGNKAHTGYAIDQDGLFVIPRANHKYGWDPIPGYEKPPVWNIYKDSLSSQSDETIDFLYNLLHDGIKSN